MSRETTKSRGPGRDQHPLVIVCGADDGFAKPLAVTLYSALSNYRGQLSANIFIINGGIGDANRSRVSRILQPLAAAVQWIEPDWGPLRHLTFSERYPASTYLRLLIPGLLPMWVEKALYLDSDLLVHGNIAELWAAPLDGLPLLAVQDKGVPTVGSKLGLSNYRELGLDASAPYFNSGVLVFDLHRWRDSELSGRVIEYLGAHPEQMGMGEQNALNAVFAGSWGALDSRWNQQVWAWEKDHVSVFPPGILHFVHTSKPWLPTGAHWSNFIYDRYFRRCGWYGTLQWWSYYVPLLVQRQKIHRVRARRASAR